MSLATLSVLLLFGLGIVCSVLIIYYLRNSTMLGSSHFQRFSLGTLLWLSGSVLELNTVGNEALSTFFIQIHLTGVILTAISFFMFSYQYTTGNDISKKYIIYLSILPAIHLIGVYSNPLLGLFWTDTVVVTQWGFEFTELVFGPLLYSHTIYSYSLVVVGSVLFLKLAVSDNELYRIQSVAIVLATVMPFISSILYVTGHFPIIEFNPTPLVLTISLVVYYLGLYRTNLYSIVPGVQNMGWNQIIDNISNGVCIVDTEGNIVDCNKTCKQIFDDRDIIKGENINTELAADLEFSFDDGTVQYFENNSKYYMVCVEDLKTENGSVVGYLLKFSDITNKMKKNQQILLLTRFLRHNLRNDLSIMDLSAERIKHLTNEQEHSENITEIHKLVSNIRKHIKKISSVGDATRNMEKVIKENITEKQYTDKIVENAIAETGTANTNVTITTDIGSTEVSVAPNYFHAISQLISNSISHNGSEDKKIYISEEEPINVSSDKFTSIHIYDNGSGISEEERNSFENELSGNSTQLNHSRGVGFILVQLYTLYSNGKFNIRENTHKFGTGAHLELVIPKFSK